MGVVSRTVNHRLASSSQFEKQRPYFTKEFIEGLARVRGVQVNEAFAEAFEVKRLKL